MRLLTTCVGALLVVTAARGEPPAWPQFRGPNGSGVADGQKPPTEFGPDKNLRWKTPIPPGISSPVVAGGRLFLTACDGGKLYTLACDAATGKELWRRDAGAKEIEPYHKTAGSPAASTPVTDGQRVVAYFGSCGLLCYDLDGKELWRHELPCARTHIGFGSGTSPVMADGLVLLVRDLANENRVLAVDLKSGEKVWQKPRAGFQTGYSTPCVRETDAGRELVVAGSLRLVGYDVKTGAERWSYRGIPAHVCPSPVADSGLLLYAGTSDDAQNPSPSFDDLLKKADADKDGALTVKEAEKLAENEADREATKGFFDSFDTDKDGKLTRNEWDVLMKFAAQGKDVALALRPGGKGELTDKHVAWSQTKGLPSVSTPLAYRGRLYLVNGKGLVTAYDVRTGEPSFQLERIAGLGRGCYASAVAANGHVYLCAIDGKVVVLEAADKVKVVSRAELGEDISATPAIADDTLYVRTAGHLYAFAVKK